ncbi:MAG TPA: GNAT family protein [Candidatus Limnocylindrales bacterium]|nr:GNAT family protein [Candidatus Limnocylindrales bacterium]
MFGPVLKGEHVTLRPADDDDPPRFLPWVSDMEVTRFLGRRTGMALYQEVDFFKRSGESKTDVLWMIEADGETVGATGLHQIDWQNAHATTGILIGAKDKWGRGIASETMRIRTRYAFRQLNLRKLMTEVFVENAASRRALEKSGYRTVGTQRQHFFTGGRWHDVWLGEVLRDEWSDPAAT